MTGATLVMATPMIRFSQAGSAANDVVGVFFVLPRPRSCVNAHDRRFALALAAVAAGLALAVKLSMVAPVLALAVGVLVISPGRARRAVLALVWLLPLLASGGFWYLRNLIAVGNPFPWLNLPGLATPAAPLQAHTGFSVLHYLTNGHVLTCRRARACVGPRAVVGGDRGARRRRAPAVRAARIRRGSCGCSDSSRWPRSPPT